ncbi:MAG: signal peptidase II [Methylococcaceae bacterium]
MLIWLLLSLAVIVLDQLSKYWVDHALSLYQSIPLIPGFQLTYVRNTGAAFSFLSQAGGWQRWFFVGLGCAASGFIGWWLWRLDRRHHVEAMAWALVLGGALGNVIDRALYGYVIDFLDVYVRDWHWPAFNVADSAICVGVSVLLIDSLRSRSAH